MSISQALAAFDPKGDKRISRGVLGYISARNRHKLFDLIVREFKKSGLTQAQLARRSGKSPEVISRVLSRPRNLEINTASEILYAICGAAIRYSIDYPSNRVLTRNVQPTKTRANEDTITYRFELANREPIERHLCNALRSKKRYTAAVAEQARDIEAEVKYVAA